MMRGIHREQFGVTPEGQSVDLFTLTNARGMEVRLISYGGIVVSLRVPDRHGRFDDVTLGYDSLEDYLRENPYLGALIGRFGNRIANGRFRLNGREYLLSTNDGPNHLHGGDRGFHTMVWEVEPFEEDHHVGAVLAHTSPAGEQGFPGTVEVRVTCTLTDQDELMFDYHATTDEATPINLTQHSYWNLAGEQDEDVLDHELLIRASRFTPVDPTLIPTGEMREVAGTPFDFTTARAVGARIGADDEQLHFAGGYDHNFVLDRPEGDGLAFAARLHEPHSGRVLEIHTTEPGLQFYSGNFLNGSLIGKQGRVYGHRSGLALETQHFPDSPNHPEFPSTVLRPGEAYTSRTVYRFLVQHDRAGAETFNRPEPAWAWDFGSGRS